MKIQIFLACTLLLAACDRPTVVPVKRVQSASELKQAALAEKTRQAAMDCESAKFVPPKDQGDLALWEADATIGRDAATTPESDSEQYREMVAADTGMLPSQANGWRDILVSKGETAQRKLDWLKEMEKRRQKDIRLACV